MIAYCIVLKFSSSGEPGPLEAEVDDEDHQHRGKGPEQVAVGGGHQTDRRAGPVRQQADDGHDQRPHEHDRLGPEEDLDVDPEALQQGPPRVRAEEHVPSEVDVAEHSVRGR